VTWYCDECKVSFELDILVLQDVVNNPSRTKIVFQKKYHKLPFFSVWTKIENKNFVFELQAYKSIVDYYKNV